MQALGTQAMNIYFLTRWGNGEEDDGPDSSNDTHLIVRASSLGRASELADPYLHRLPESTEEGRKVAMFTQCAVLLGATNDAKELEGVICWPWYSFSPPQCCASTWVRDSIAEGWLTHEEYYGEPPPLNENA